MRIIYSRATQLVLKITSFCEIIARPAPADVAALSKVLHRYLFRGSLSRSGFSCQLMTSAAMRYLMSFSTADISSSDILVNNARSMSPNSILISIKTIGPQCAPNEGCFGESLQMLKPQPATTFLIVLTQSRIIFRCCGAIDLELARLLE